MKKSSKATLVPRKAVAAPPPIVSFESNSNGRLTKDSVVSKAGTVKDTEPKVAWGGVAELQRQQLQSKVVSSDGSIMPKPGEVIPKLASALGKGNGKGYNATTNVENVPAAERHETNWEWDSRERRKPLGRPRGGGGGGGGLGRPGPRGHGGSSLTAEALSAAAAAAAVASQASSVPPVMQQRKPLVKVPDPKSLQQQQQQQQQQSQVRQTNIEESKSTLKEKQQLGKVPSNESRNTSLGFTPITKDSNGNSNSNTNAKPLTSKLSIAIQQQQQQQHEPSQDEQKPVRSQNNNNNNKMQFPNASSTSSSSSSSKSASMNWRTGDAGSTSNPFSSKHHNNGQQQHQPYQKGGNKIRQGGFYNGGGGGPGGTSESQVAWLNKELEKTREEKSSLLREVKDLKRTNFELQQRLNSQNKELSILKRELHEARAINSRGTVQASGKSSSDSMEDGTSGEVQGRNGTNDEESPLLQSLMKNDKDKRGRPSTVEAIVNDLFEKVLDSFPPNDLRAEAIPLEKQVVMRIDYQDVMTRPQVQFEDVIDNRNEVPFIPKLRQKIHCVEPLNPHQLMNQPWISPYQREIFELRYPASQLARPSIIREIKEMDSGRFFFVSQPHQLEEMLFKFHSQGVHEVAVDLENHSHRSFQGFVCLMQLSTRTEDYIIDAIGLRSHLHILAQVFANPMIVKVFHGADKDILWLQRDFGLYVVNMFDTACAARELRYPFFSYSYVLERFTGIKANKEYQLADWRIRPLPTDLVIYACQDTHFLLDIYDRMRCELLDRGTGFMESVLRASSQICLQTYAKPHFDEKYVSALLGQLQRVHNYKLHSNAQKKVFESLIRWRDQVARIRDESIHYVMDDFVTFQIARYCPWNLRSLEACLKAANCQVPPLVYELRSSIFWEIANVLDPISSSGVTPAPTMIGFGWFNKNNA